MTVPSNNAVRALRPSLVIAEALVDRHGPTQIVNRAKKLGFSPDLTNAVVGVCCGRQHCEPSSVGHSRQPSLKPSQS